jgi:hypothetical protein
MKLRRRALELDPELEDAAETTNAAATEPQPEDDGGEEQRAADVARAAFMAGRVLSPKRNLRAEDEVEEVATDEEVAAPEPAAVEPERQPDAEQDTQPQELLARALHSFVAEDTADLGFAEGEVRGHPTDSTAGNTTASKGSPSQWQSVVS